MTVRDMQLRVTELFIKEELEEKCCGLLMNMICAHCACDGFS